MTEFDPNNTGGGEQLPMSELRGIALGSLVKLQRIVRREVESSSSAFLAHAGSNIRLLTAGHNLYPNDDGVAVIRATTLDGDHELPLGKMQRKMWTVDPDTPGGDPEVTEDIGSFVVDLDPAKLSDYRLSPLAIRNTEENRLEIGESLLGTGAISQEGSEDSETYNAIVSRLSIAGMTPENPSPHFAHLEVAGHLPPRGDSGGPWIDSEGRAVGITVAARQEEESRFMAEIRLLDSSALGYVGLL